MQKIIIALITCISILFFSTPNQSFSASEHRIALVIGNGSYISSPLRNPINDATDVATALRKCGFNVTLQTDVRQKTMKKAIAAFGRELRKGGVGLFYFSGHGVQLSGRNYLMPIGADIESESDVEFEAVDAGRVLGKMQDAGNQINIMILDACRNNPYGSRFRSSKRGLAVIPAPQGAVVAYSTSPGGLADDGSGRNGLYTSMLLKHILTPDLTVERFFKMVGKDVSVASQNRQVPWVQTSLVDDFFFNIKTGAPIVKPIVDTPKVASISPVVKEPKIIDSKGSYLRYSTGVVYDESTGLEWYAGPDKDTKWDDAKAWVENLNVAGGGWRMPTKEQLSALYEQGIGSRNMTPLLKTTGWFVWSGEEKDSSSIWVFDFGPGEMISHIGDYPNDRRSFAVRSRKE